MEKNEYKTTKNKYGLFTYLEKKLPITSLLPEGLPPRYFSLLAFGFSLGLVYVANTHYYERKIRTITKLEQEVKTLRVECTVLKSRYMLDSKQSVLAQRVAPLGLYESTTPPTRIKSHP